MATIDDVFDLLTSLVSSGRILADVRAINGDLTSGNNATLKLKQLSVINPDDDAVDLVSAGGAAIALVTNSGGYNPVYIEAAPGRTAVKILAGHADGASPAGAAAVEITGGAASDTMGGAAGQGIVITGGASGYAVNNAGDGLVLQGGHNSAGTGGVGATIAGGASDDGVGNIGLAVRPGVGTVENMAPVFGVGARSFPAILVTGSGGGMGASIHGGDAVEDSAGTTPAGTGLNIWGGDGATDVLSGYALKIGTDNGPTSVYICKEGGDGPVVHIDAEAGNADALKLEASGTGRPLTTNPLNYAHFGFKLSPTTLGATVTAEISTDGSDFETLAAPITELSHGWYEADLSDVFMTGETRLRFVNDGATATAEFKIKTYAPTPESSGGDSSGS